jgi:hypothetical protein
MKKIKNLLLDIEDRMDQLKKESEMYHRKEISLLTFYQIQLFEILDAYNKNKDIVEMCDAFLMNVEVGTYGTVHGRREIQDKLRQIVDNKE